MPVNPETTKSRCCHTVRGGIARRKRGGLWGGVVLLEQERVLEQLDVLFIMLVVGSSKRAIGCVRSWSVESVVWFSNGIQAGMGRQMQPRLTGCRSLGWMIPVGIDRGTTIKNYQ
jgi:hypothetical protein